VELKPENVLLLAVALPAVAAIVVWMLGSTNRSVSRRIALAVTLVELVLAGMLVFNFPGIAGEATSGDAAYAVSDIQWLGGDSPFDVSLSFGLDGLSLWLFALSTLLMITSVLVSWEAIKDRPAAFYSLLLLLEAGILGVFAARDIILFYVCFEFTLIPLFFLIGGWGSEERRYAAMKFFLFTLAGSVLTFLSLLAIVLWDRQHAGTGVMTFSIPLLTEHLTEHPMPDSLQLMIFLGLFAGFAIKVPLFPLHTWLPLAHVQAPTAGSVMLAGVLLKIGTYGFLRFSIPMLPEATAVCAPYLLWLAVAGIIYGALVALAQTDMKRLIAYSSVSHLGFCMLGIFALNPAGVQGGALQMVNHGLSTGGLFAIVGMLYERYHTREIKHLGGLCRQVPLLTLMMLLFTFSSIGLPGMNGFAGEFPLLLGMFQRAWTAAPVGWVQQYRVISIVAVSGVVLGAWYMLLLVKRVFFGPLKEPAHDETEPPVRDLTLREGCALAPLLVFVFWIGLQPRFFLEPMAPALDRATQAATQRVNEDVPFRRATATKSDHKSNTGDTTRAATD
jgi:NADH-quinone oxidoreductase subunit M